MSATKECGVTPSGCSKPWISAAMNRMNARTPCPSPMVGMLEELFARRSDKPLVAALVTLALPGSKRFVLEFNQQVDSQLPSVLAGPGC
jgi:hypothetical protein